MTTAEVRDAINGLLADYVHYIDADRLEEWLDFFTEDCVYKVLPRENVKQGLPGSLMECHNKNMLRDRIVSYREANEYNIHVDRHLLSNVRIVGENAGVYDVEANYAVFQTNNDGESRLFSVGNYEDKVVFDNGSARFKEKIVVVDTYSIPTLLATPL